MEPKVQNKAATKAGKTTDSGRRKAQLQRSPQKATAVEGQSQLAYSAHSNSVAQATARAGHSSDTPTSSIGSLARMPIHRTTPRVQPSLIVGAANDAYEQQAHETAAQVTGTVQRSAAVAGAPFEAPEGFDEAIRRSSGGGAALSPTLRSEFEPAFGADFSRVRIHSGAESNSLAQTIQAKAFTHGQDIHFADGVYDDRSTAGRALIAHELTHTVQQGASPVVQRTAADGTLTPAAALQQVGGSLQRVVQRAVGFEFETAYVVEREKGDKSGWEYLPKGTLIKGYSDGLKMETDIRGTNDSVIEMVLDPPVQENDTKKFKSVLKEFNKIGKGFMDVRKQQDVPLNTISGVSGPKNFRVKPTLMGFTGNPQMSIGVAYDQLYEFIKQADAKTAGNDPALAAKTAITGKIGQEKETVSVSGAERAVQAINGSDELKGLVVMLSMYLNSGAGVAKGMFKYAKLISNSFLSRTDFGSMFNKLPQTDKARFIGDRDSFVTLVLDAAGLSGTNATKVFERGIRKSDDANSPDYNVDLTADPALGLDISREKWLKTLTQGHDPISSYHMPHLQQYLMGLGALGERTDRVGNDPKPAKGAKDKGAGIIMELRNMRDMQDYDRFSVLALQVFEYVKQFNA